MNNFLTFHAEATPDGVNIMYRSNDGMTERVDTVSYTSITTAQPGVSGLNGWQTTSNRQLKLFVTAKADGEV